MRVLAIAALFLICSAGLGLAGQIVVDAGRGPVVVETPSSYDPDRPLPLVLSLHGYSGNGASQNAYFNLGPLAEQEGFLYAYPSGTIDAISNRFWNATDACCDLFGSGVDDSTYLLSLVSLIRNQLAVNPWRVHFVGHSNGGFMSYRMACDHADVVASIGSLAGATFFDTADCNPISAVHTLQIHGTNDSVILYNGGNIGGVLYPGALDTTESWATYDGCDLTPDLSAPPLDLDASILGNESTVRRYAAGCETSGSAELWTIPAGSHSPSLTDGFRTGLVDFLLSRPKAGTAFTDAQTLTWPPLRWGSRYRVYRGELADLFDGNGDGLPDPGYGECISDADPDPTDTVMIDGTLPSPGEGFYYLVGFAGGLGFESVLGTTSDGWARLPTTTCP